MKRALICEVLEGRARDSLRSLEKLLSLDHERVAQGRAFLPLLALATFTPSRPEIESLEMRGLSQAVVGTWVGALAAEVENWHFGAFELSEGMKDPTTWCASAVDRVLQQVLEAIPEDDVAQQEEAAAQEVKS